MFLSVLHLGVGGVGAGQLSKQLLRERGLIFRARIIDLPFVHEHMPPPKQQQQQWQKNNNNNSKKQQQLCFRMELLLLHKG